MVQQAGGGLPTYSAMGPSNAILHAVNHETGWIATVDYRWVDVYAAFTYLPNLDLGIAMKPDWPLHIPVGRRSIRT